MAPLPTLSLSKDIKINDNRCYQLPNLSEGWLG